MTVIVNAGGYAGASAASAVPDLVNERIASRLFAHDDTIWGPAARSEASIRLGWLDAVQISRPLLPRIHTLRERFLAAGIDRFVLCGMGGSSLAPEVIAASNNIDLVVLDSTDPEQVRTAVTGKLERTAVIVSSKSGSTLETDSQRRSFETAFTKAGIDPAQRFVVVTDPGSPLEKSALDAGYEVFTADPNVGGRYSALTAFGLVPSGLAGANIDQLLDDAGAITGLLAEDREDNPALVLGAALAAGAPARDKIGIFSASVRIHGFAAWAEQLIAESTGKQGTGLLPIALLPDSPEVVHPLEDVTLVRIADGPILMEGELVDVSGTLGELLLLWEVAIAVAGQILGIDPFDQPDVESAKIATRALLDDQPEPVAAQFIDSGIAVRSTFPLDATTIAGAVRELVARLSAEDGYLALQAYLDRVRDSDFAEIRETAAGALHRPVTFGWGPRFLHSTGQYHKGGPRTGVFLQITSRQTPSADLPIPGRPFTFGALIAAQAAGDAQVLADHGLPVLSLELLQGAESGKSVLDNVFEGLTV